MAILASAILHIALIASVNFTYPSLRFEKDKMPALDVVLVNAKTKSKPKKADALAQANLDRGGNAEENRQMKSSLPPPKIKTSELTVAEQTQAASATMQAAKAQAEEERQQERVAELEKQAQEIMTQLNSIKKIETKPTHQATAVSPAEAQASISNANAKDLMETTLEIARLEAQIAKQQDEYQKRPKRKALGARTQEYRFATYVESWRQKVEKVGNLNYPTAAKEQKIYGKLRMTVSIKSDGSIEKIRINQSSGHRILDEGARHIVEIAAPYPKFPESLSKDTDVIDITRTWTFTKEDGLATKSE